MPESVQIIVGVLFLILVFIATRYGIFLRIKSACKFVVKDLERQKAFDADSAVGLPYAKSSYFHIGLRDFRPKAVQSLVEGGVIGKTAEENYYLKVTPVNLEVLRESPEGLERLRVTLVRGVISKERSQ